MSREPYKLGYHPSLNGVRGLAIILVLLNHGEILGTGFGFVGVNTFFVLSGFLITCLLVAEFDKSGKINFSQFYLRRARRLFPALFVLLFVYLIYALFVHNFFPAMKETLFALFYVTNWAHIFGFQNDGGLAHTWSLSIEEQYY